MIGAPKTLRWRLGTKPEDVLPGVALGYEFHQRSHFADLTFDFDKAEAIGRDALDPSGASGFVLTEVWDKETQSYEVVGLALATLGEYMFGRGEVLCTCTVFYLGQGLSSILRGKAALGQHMALKSWAKARGAKQLQYHLTADLEPEGSARFFEKVAPKKLGGNFSLVL